jgi:hypothetical protein
MDGAIRICFGIFFAARFGNPTLGEWWYLFKNHPTYVLDRPKLEGVVDTTVNVPILGLVSALVKDWIPLIDEYYYCE